MISCYATSIGQSSAPEACTNVIGEIYENRIHNEFHIPAPFLVGYVPANIYSHTVQVHFTDNAFQKLLLGHLCQIRVTKIIGFFVSLRIFFCQSLNIYQKCWFISLLKAMSPIVMVGCITNKMVVISQLHMHVVTSSVPRICSSDQLTFKLRLNSPLVDLSMVVTQLLMLCVLQDTVLCSLHFFLYKDFLNCKHITQTYESNVYH